MLNRFEAPQQQPAERYKPFKMTNLLTIPFLILFLSCSSTVQNDGVKPNVLPMFGKKQLTTEMVRINEDFVKRCDSVFKDRKEACAHHIERGWQYFYSNHLDTSMMRFNQAWLLDSSNADIYWGFGNILGKQHKFKESIPFFEKSIKLNPNNAIVWQCISISYGNLFFETKDIKTLNKSIDCLMTSLKLDSHNATTLAQLAASYTYFTRKDSALKYLRLADQIDPSKVNPEVRQLLKR